MTMAATIDTLAYAKRLMDAGVPQKQAEVQAEMLSEIIEEKLATQQDLHESTRTVHEDVKEIKYSIAELDKNLRQEIALKNAELKADLIKWVVGVSAAQTAVIFSVLVSMLKLFH